MFVYSLLKGLRKGYIHGGDYFNAAQSAYQYINKTFVQPAANGLANFTGTVIVSSNAFFLKFLKNLYFRLEVLMAREIMM